MWKSTIFLDKILAVLFGSWLGYITLGPAALDFFNISWMRDDVAQYYVGWGFFRHGTSWQLPLLWSSDLGYPLGICAADLDVIPPLALLFRLFSPILPQTFQYFGPYGVACCILQLYFGLKLCRKLAPARPLAALAGALFVGCAPPFIFRLYAGQFALSSHWLILAALTYLYGQEATGSIFLSLMGINIVAAAVNPYIAAMVFLLSIGAIGRRTRQNRRLVQLLAIFVVSLGTMSLAGFLSGGTVGGGYGQYSMNLLAPIDPMKFPSLILPAQRDHFVDQYEGYNYLGAGAILLGICALVRRPALLLRTALEDRFAVQRWVFLISLLLALSVCATAGTWVIYYIPVPARVFDALSAFRSSGRLFWPGYYILLLAILAAVLKAFPGRAGTLLIGAAFLLQFFDTASLRAASFQMWDRPPVVSPLRAPVWATLGQRYRHLVVLPAWQCFPYRNNGQDTPGGFPGYQIFGFLAIGQHMSVNDFYAARMSGPQTRYFCHDETDELRRNGPAADTAYVFALGDPLAGAVDHRNGVVCRPTDGFALCTGK